MDSCKWFQYDNNRNFKFYFGKKCRGFYLKTSKPRFLEKDLFKMYKELARMNILRFLIFLKKLWPVKLVG